MRHRSAAKARQHRARIAMLRAAEADLERCQWPAGCTERAVDADEKLARSQGGDPADPANITLLCRAHHDWRHAHPTDALTIGLRIRAVAQPRRNVYTGGVAKEPRTEVLTSRVTPEGMAWIDQLAHDHHTDRATVVRACLAVAAEHPAVLTRRLTLVATA